MEDPGQSQHHPQADTRPSTKGPALLGLVVVAGVLVQLAQLGAAPGHTGVFPASSLAPPNTSTARTALARYQRAAADNHNASQMAGALDALLEEALSLEQENMALEKAQANVTKQVQKRMEAWEARQQQRLRKAQAQQQRLVGHPDFPQSGCLHSGEGFGMCFYSTPVCTDGKRVIVVGASGSQDSLREVRGRLTAGTFDLNWAGQPSRQDVPPVPSVWTVREIPKDQTVVWMDKVLFLDGPMGITNIYLDLHTPTVPILEAMRRRESSQLPPFTDVVAMFRHDRDVKTLFHLDKPVTWCEHLLHGLVKQRDQGHTRVLSQRRLGEELEVKADNKWLCSRQATVASQIGYQAVPGVQGQRMLREVACGEGQVKCDTSAREAIARTGVVQVLVLDRKSRDEREGGYYDRRFDDLDRVLAVLDKFAPILKYKVVVVSSSTAFADQVEAFASAQLVITGHGAGIANCAFLPTGAAVIEVFPLGIYRPGYRKMLNSMGVHYFPVYSQMQGKGLSWHYMDAWKAPAEDAVKLAHKCHGMPLLRQSRECWQDFLRSSIEVPLREFEIALVKAVRALHVKLPREVEFVAALNADGVVEEMPALPSSFALEMQPAAPREWSDEEEE